MSTVQYGPWPNGQDARPIAETGDAKTFRDSLNIDLTTDGSVQARDGLRPIATLDSHSVGLYTLNGTLRTVVPSGHSLPAALAANPTIFYDAIGDGSAYAYGSISKLTAVTSWGVNPAQGAYPYLCIQRDTGHYEHHWITSIPAPSVNGSPPPAYVPSTAPANTKIALGFEPGESLLKIQDKICAPDNTNGVVRFSSTRNGPSDWTAVSDAGFLPVLQHSTGDRQMKALGVYDTMMAVIFTDSVQFWKMSPDPALHELTRVMNGPGTDFARSVVNVRGDLIYFSRGTFSSLHTVAYSGQLTEGDIGAMIAPLTQLYPSTVTPIALWSQARAQYICAFGADVWVYTSSPTSKVFGWRKWVLPVAVEYMVECAGKLYVRSANTVYVFDPTYADGTTFQWTSHFLDCGQHGVRKLIQTVDLIQQGSCTISFLPDSRDPTQVDTIGTVSGNTSTLDDIGVFETTETFAFRFSGTIGDATRWKLNRFKLNYRAAEIYGV